MLKIGRSGTRNQSYRALGALAIGTAGAIVPIGLLAGPAGAGSTIVYTPGTSAVATLSNGSAVAPWNTAQGDPGAGASYTSKSPGSLLPTYTPGGATTTLGGVTEPNLAVYPSANSTTPGVAPYPSGVAGTPGPLDGYCGTGAQPESGTVNRQPSGTFPFSPYYFPHVIRDADGDLTGYFDYRPKDADEALVAATSTDGGQDWTYNGEVLEQNPGYCPSADTNDDGEGHTNVIIVGGSTFLYTLERAAGDNEGVGMLVHPFSPTEANPLAGLPAVEKTGIDPDAFATSAATVSATATTINLNTTGTTSIGTNDPEQLVAGEFVDLNQDPVPTAADVIACTGVGITTLTGCTNAAGVSVASGDLIEQVIATVKTAATIPAGPNNSAGTGGLASLSVTFANPAIGNIYNANAPNRAYIDGVAVYCNNANANPTTAMEDCTTGPGGSSVSAAVGDPVTSDPIVPATAEQTNGLVAPDGIVGVLPSYPGAPAGSTVIAYTEKILNYYVAGTTGAATTLGTSLSFTPSATASEVLPATVSSGSPVSLEIGDNTKDAIITITCTGLTTGATDSLTGCTEPAGDAGDAVSKSSEIATTQACSVPGTSLAATGEGSTTSTAKLFKNNEDLTVLRAAYTTDGINFSTSGLANGGIISGASDGASNYQDINNPVSTTSPSNLNAYATPGTADATEMRWVGSAGSIITNSDGSYGMFLSGAWCGDGDSDAFNQIFYSSSTDGENWTIPTTVVSTDYTFSASAAQDTALAGGTDAALGISAYYSGRAYGPSVVQNPDGSLTMIFAGYRSPKPIPIVGTTLGLWTVEASDPALYRNIMVVDLTTSPPSDLPETPFVLALPLLGAAVLGGSVYLTYRRRRRLIAT